MNWLLKEGKKDSVYIKLYLLYYQPCVLTCFVFWAEMTD